MEEVFVVIDHFNIAVRIKGYIKYVKLCLSLERK